MLHDLLGLIIGASVGGLCQYFDLPLPAPPKLFGALIVVFTTLGFLAADYLMGSGLY